jgi:hypothetical protein
MYLFNSTEWCYIKRTTYNILQILLQAYILFRMQNNIWSLSLAVPDDISKNGYGCKLVTKHHERLSNITLGHVLM